MGKPTYNPEHLDKLALYEAVVAKFPDLKRKGAKNPYTSHNGHMFSFLTQEGRLAIRLSKEQRGVFMETFGTTQPVQYGALMKEYVYIPDDMLADTEQLAKHFERSYTYVQSLKPKPTKRGKMK